jgi:UDP-2,4-diacetamido-2,4,6-trideoxy-beta-L-altropyranose hydrolase
MIHVFIHFEASPQIGLGHAIRCLNLAKSLKKHAKINLFISPTTKQIIAERIDLDFQTIPFDHRGTNINFSTGYDKNVLILDNYELGEEFENQFHKKMDLIFVIDDLANRKHHCQLLLDQTAGLSKSRYLNLVPKECHILTGADYALISPLFESARQKSIARRQEPNFTPKNLLVALGGADPDNITGQLISDLDQINFLSSIDIVIGSASLHKTTLKNDIKNRKKTFTLHHNLTSLCPLLQTTDIVIGAGGVSAIERCVLGIPSLLIEIADNQKQMIAQLEQMNAAINIGSPSQLSPSTLKHALEQMQDRSTYQVMSQSAANVCDGKGLERVCSHLLNLTMGST